MKIVALVFFTLGVFAAIGCADRQSAVPTPDIDATVSAGIRATQAADVSIDATVQARVAATLTTPYPTATPWPTPTPRPTPAPTATLPPTPAPDEIVVASVNGVQFTTGNLAQRIRLFAAINPYRDRETDLNVVPFEHLQEWIFAEIRRQQAPALGIQPSEGAITEELLAEFRPATSPGQETNTESLDRESVNNYQSFLIAAGLSDSGYRAIVEERLTLDSLTAMLAENIRSAQEQVEVRWIRFPDTDTDVVEITDRIRDQDFGAVVQEFAAADNYADSSGYVGWVPRGAFPDLDPFLYGDDDRGLLPLAPGETSQPVFTQDGIYILNILSVPALHELSDKMQVKLTTELVQAWHEERLRTGAEDGSIRINFNSTVYDWVADQVRGIQSVRR